MNKFFFLLISSIVFLNCVTKDDISLPKGESKIVLMGYVDPDSVLAVKISQSVSINESLIANNINAKVAFQENGISLNFPLNTDNKGKFWINYQPKFGNKYRVNVIVNGKEYNAEDTLIEPSKIMLSKLKNEPITNFSYKFAELTVIEPKHYLYLSVYDYVKSKENLAIVSQSQWFDPIGSFIEDDKISRSYQILYAKLNNEIFKNSETKIKFSFYPYNEETTPTLNVMFCSADGDRFLKSLMLYLINKPVNDNGKVENPFLDPTKVYSNIKGGLGFWGAIQTKKIKIEK